MSRPPHPVLHDPARLAALRRTALLDTPPEEAFDRLTRVAARVVEVPATFLSLVDERRDFYKSCFGFGEPLASTRQLEGTTFCHYSIVSD
ncbi:MAG: sensor domain-containing diguanylate cyclase, partial [Gemmatimonadota bacterium]|nr:sensor domain-containing diguanylate cyclase [Gemmatimonadota bacterium]